MCREIVTLLKRSQNHYPEKGQPYSVPMCQAKASTAFNLSRMWTVLHGSKQLNHFATLRHKDPNEKRGSQNSKKQEIYNSIIRRTKLALLYKHDRMHVKMSKHDRFV